MAEASAQTRQLATQQNALRLNRPVLLGIFGADSALRAMIRHPDGRIDTVGTGDTFRLGRVIAIDDDALHIARNGGTDVLRLPQPGQRASTLRPRIRPHGATNSV